MESQAVRTAPKDLNRFPFRDIRRQPSRSIHAIARKPSSFNSWIHSG
jgi:hypothetical protein